MRFAIEMKTFFQLLATALVVVTTNNFVTVVGIVMLLLIRVNEREIAREDERIATTLDHRRVFRRLVAILRW